MTDTPRLCKREQVHRHGSWWNQGLYWITYFAWCISVWNTANKIDLGKRWAYHVWMCKNHHVRKKVSRFETFSSPWWHWWKDTKVGCWQVCICQNCFRIHRWKVQEDVCAQWFSHDRRNALAISRQLQLSTIHPVKASRIRNQNLFIGWCKNVVHLQHGTVPWQPAPNSPFQISTSAFDTVMRLAEPIKNSRRCITADNWFTSIPLVLKLLSLNLTYVGTIRSNKKEVPFEFRPKQPKPKPNEPKKPKRKPRKLFSTMFGFLEDKATLVSYVPKKKQSGLVCFINAFERRYWLNFWCKKTSLDQHLLQQKQDWSWCRRPTLPIIRLSKNHCAMANGHLFQFDQRKRDQFVGNLQTQQQHCQRKNKIWLLGKIGNSVDQAARAETIEN